MTKIKLISDIHVDCGIRDHGKIFIDSLPVDDAYILVVAGDVVTGGEIENYFDTFDMLCQKYPHVVFVMGNHDHYDHTIEEAQDIVEEFTHHLPNLYWLQNNRLTLGNHNFIGATLWFNRCQINKWWPDFRFINRDAPEQIFQEFEKSRDFLKKNIQKGDIVITHHLPSMKAIHPRWKNESSNKYFVGDIEDIILKRRPAKWFFGHTHDERNLQIGDTHLLCNARGYPQEYSSSGFDKELVIDLDLEE